MVIILELFCNAEFYVVAVQLASQRKRLYVLILDSFQSPKVNLHLRNGEWRTSNMIEGVGEKVARYTDVTFLNGRPPSCRAWWDRWQHDLFEVSKIYKCVCKGRMKIVVQNAKRLQRLCDRGVCKEFKVRQEVANFSIQCHGLNLWGFLSPGAKGHAHSREPSRLMITCFSPFLFVIGQRQMPQRLAGPLKPSIPKSLRTPYHFFVANNDREGTQMIELCIAVQKWRTNKYITKEEILQFFQHQRLCLALEWITLSIDPSVQEHDAVFQMDTFQVATYSKHLG